MVLMLLFGCGRSTAATTAEPSVGPSAGPDAASVTRLRVSFGSQGSGTDDVAEHAFLALLWRTEDRLGHSLGVTQQWWGREGETDYCLALPGLTPAEVQDFVAATRVTLAQSHFVQIEESVACSERPLSTGPPTPLQRPAQ